MKLYAKQSEAGEFWSLNDGKYQNNKEIICQAKQGKKIYGKMK